MAAAFEERGFARLPGFIARDELPAFRAAVDAVLAAPLPPGCERPHNSLAPLRFDSELVLAALGSPRRVARLREAVGATDLRWISGYVSVKPGRSGPLWWHQDWWCWDHPVSFEPAAAQVAVLCYLADTDPARGALRVLPGTHRRSSPLHAVLPRAHSAGADELADDHPAFADQPGQVTLAARAGDAFVCDYRLLHGTHPNTTPHRRDCLLLTFAPAWARLPDDIRAHLIRHPAQPQGGDATAPVAALLPRYDGVPRDLPLSRDAPARLAA
jgi:ectoine hydroxylase-related dioxygenase (phytanoyl-CoA dioxygenase family)